MSRYSRAMLLLEFAVVRRGQAFGGSIKDPYEQVSSNQERSPS